MENFFLTLIIFIVKSVVVILAILIVIFALVALIVFIVNTNKSIKNLEKIKIVKFNKPIKDFKRPALKKILSEKDFKVWQKENKAFAKEEKKKKKAKIFVLNFTGDVKASQVKFLRKEVSLLLEILDKNDQVLIRLSSPGGEPPGYGQAAAELLRIKNNSNKLTIAVDQVAASGGYLISCVADEIVAAPFAIVGSIGVMTAIPNVNKLLKKNDIDFNIYTAGKYKRTVTVFGENTEEGIKKFKEDIANMHKLFKEFVVTNRPSLDIEKVSTGEWWFAKDALNLNLVDSLMTSEEYLVGKSTEFDIFEISYHEKQPLYKNMAVGINYLLKAVWKNFPKTIENDITQRM